MAYQIIDKQYSNELKKLETQATTQREQIKAEAKEARANLAKVRPGAVRVPQTPGAVAVAPSTRRDLQEARGEIDKWEREQLQKLLSAHLTAQKELQASRKHADIEYKEAVKQAKLEAERFVPEDTVKLATGELIEKAAFKKLPLMEQELLRAVGIQEYNKLQEIKVKREMEKYVYLPITKEYIDKTEFQKLTSEQQTQLKARGIESFNKYMEAVAHGKWAEAMRGEQVKYEEVVKEQKRIEKELAPYKAEEGYNLLKMLEKGYSTSELVSLGFQKSDIQDTKEFLASSITLSTGELVLKEAFKEMSLEAQSKLQSLGLEKYNKWVDEQNKLYEDWAKQYTSKELSEIESGKYQVYNYETDKFVSATQKEKAKREEYYAAQQVLGYNIGPPGTPGTITPVEAEKRFKVENIEVSPGEWVDKEAFNDLPEGMQEAARAEGLESINIENLKPEAQFEKMQDWGMIEKDDEYGGVDDEGNILLKDGRPWTEKYLTLQMAKGVGIGMIPIYGTIYYWSAMGPKMQTLSIAADVACFIPFGIAISTGVRSGMKLSTVLGRAVLAEIKAPITAITHPIGTAKAIIRPLTFLLKPRAIPTAAAEIRSFILKIPVKSLGKAKTAMKARDILTTAAIRGEKASIVIGDQTIDLAKVALQQKAIPVAVHTTYDIRPFLQGAKIQKGAEGLGMFVAPSLNTRLTKCSALGRGLTPAPDIGAFEWTGRFVRKIGKYLPEDIAKLDLPAVRSLRLVDATDIPADIAPKLQAYIRANKEQLWVASRNG